MKIETILSALGFALVQCSKLGMLQGLDPYSSNDELMEKRNRQYRAFRARILRMDTEKDKFYFNAWKASQKRCGELHQAIHIECELHELEIAEKDAEIAQLRIRVEALSDPNYFSKLIGGRR